MARGDKSAYTDKQKRMAEHIEEGYEERGVSTEEAERRAWATVNKETGGGRATREGRIHTEERIDAGSAPRLSEAEHQKRSESAKKGWETRRKADNR